MLTPPPVLMVSELIAVPVTSAAGVLVSSTLVPLVKALVTISVLVFSARRMFEAAPSVVAKLVPRPLALLSTMMY